MGGLILMPDIFAVGHAFISGSVYGAATFIQNSICMFMTTPQYVAEFFFKVGFLLLFVYELPICKNAVRCLGSCYTIHQKGCIIRTTAGVYPDCNL